MIVRLHSCVPGSSFNWLDCLFPLFPLSILSAESESGGLSAAVCPLRAPVHPTAVQTLCLSERASWESAGAFCGVCLLALHVHSGCVLKGCVGGEFGGWGSVRENLEDGDGGEGGVCVCVGCVCVSGEGGLVLLCLSGGVCVCLGREGGVEGMCGGGGCWVACLRVSQLCAGVVQAW